MRRCRCHGSDNTTVCPFRMKASLVNKGRNPPPTKFSSTVSRYGIAFTWEDGRVSSYREITDDDAWWEGTGAQVLVSHRENGQTVYRDLGMDRAESGDDILHLLCLRPRGGGR